MVNKYKNIEVVESFEDKFTSIKKAEDYFEDWFAYYNKKYKSHNILEKIIDNKGNEVNIKNLCRMCFIAGYSTCSTEIIDLLKEDR